MENDLDLQRAIHTDTIEWNFIGRIMVVDNGARLPRRDDFYALMALDAFSTVIFDPLNTLESNEKLKKINELQIIPNATLGDGKATHRFDCLYEETSATLEPLPHTLQVKNKRYGTIPNKLLIKPLIDSIILDKIEGLNKLDWFLLDNKNDNLKILQHSKKKLKETLLIDIQIPFHFSHINQLDFSSAQEIMSSLGFDFLCFTDTHKETPLPTEQYLEKLQASKLVAASALFIPNDIVLEKTEENKLRKLSFILHSFYNICDIPYKLLKIINANEAEKYLYTEGFKILFDKDETEFTLSYENSPDIWANPYEDYQQEDL